MAISEKKMQIVMNNYFKAECDINTSIREAFEKGFRIGVQKGYDVTKQICKWIPVTERLPEEEKDVLVSVHFDGYKDEYTNYPPSNYVEIASRIDGVWYSVYDEFRMMRRYYHIVAWMEEPKPYRGE